MAIKVPSYLREQADTLRRDGRLYLRQEMKLLLRLMNRFARASNHSATHLMHKALKGRFGRFNFLKGSNVDAASFCFWV